MAQFDLKKALINICDGTKASVTIGAGAAGITFTDASKHRGTQAKPTVTFVVSGNNTPLTVTVSGKDVTVNVATDSGGAATSTANQVVAAVNASTPASALVVAAPSGAGTGVVGAQTKTSLTGGANFVSCKIAEGTIEFDEKRPVIYTKDRGLLSNVKLGDQEPMSVKIDSILEFWQNDVSVSPTPSPEDALKQRGNASAWVTTDEDVCNPYCVDIEIHYAPGCSVPDEFKTAPYFRYEDIRSRVKEGILEFSGKCNATVALDYRGA